jgi:hypothetical protein
VLIVADAGGTITYRQVTEITDEPNEAALAVL